MDISVTDRPDAGRYEANGDGRVVGFAEYYRQANKTYLTHTEVDPDVRGQGVAGELARVALDDARRRGDAVVPRCSYMARWIGEHPDYADLVADRG